MLTKRVRCRPLSRAVQHIGQHNGGRSPLSRTTLRSHSDTTLEHVAGTESHAGYLRGNARAVNLLDLLLPRSRFGNSIFTTPLLLLFRLFYQARSLELPSARAEAFSYGTPVGQSISSNAARTDAHARQHRHAQPRGRAVDLCSKKTPSEWLASMRDDQNSPYSSITLRSLTWTKSLSAPLSHEFIQLVLECNTSGRRDRIIAERDTYGDSVYCIASTSDDSTPSGLANAALAHLDESDAQHKLPLPLLSLSWSHLPPPDRPSAIDLARTLTSISCQAKKYNWLREHCWWFAEAVFEAMLAPSAPNQARPMMKEWPWSAYRYSHVVIGKKFLRREGLVQAATNFRHEMDDNGELCW